MAYPQYDITFATKEGGVAKIESLNGEPAPRETDGSHTFVLTVNGTKLKVHLTHRNEEERTPELILTFE